MSRVTELAYAIADVVAVLTDDTIACDPRGAVLSLSLRGMGEEYRREREQERQFSAAIDAATPQLSEHVISAVRAAMLNGHAL